MSDNMETHIDFDILFGSALADIEVVALFDSSAISVTMLGCSKQISSPPSGQSRPDKADVPAPLSEVTPPIEPLQTVISSVATVPATGDDGGPSAKSMSARYVSILANSMN
jgi:hypothetical protein